MITIRKTFLLFLWSFICMIGCKRSTHQTSVIVERGFQPSLSVDTTGIVRMTYGVGDSIFYAESNDSGRTFLKEVLVDTLRNLHLGMARGPQISSSANYTLIVAMNKPGDMYAYSLEHSKDTWSKKNRINDVPRVAKEGLASVGSDQVDIFYATWLDLRDDNKNKVYLSKSLRGGVQWEENVLVYRSPDSTVCECCRPTIAVSGENVFVMFRNWLNGSRDMYVAKSGNQSIHFSEPVKIGEGTWKLNGCPMDGGGLTVYNTGEVMSTWRREGDVFISSMNQRERKLGSGKQSDIASSGSNYGVTWSDEEQIYFASSAQSKPFVIGKGSFPTIEALKNKNYLIAWEEEGSIKVHVVPGLK